MPVITLKIKPKTVPVITLKIKPKTVPVISETSVIEFLATQPDGATSKVIAKHFGVKPKLINSEYTDEHAELFDSMWPGIRSRWAWVAGIRTMPRPATRPGIYVPPVFYVGDMWYDAVGQPHRLGAVSERDAGELQVPH